MLTLEQEISTNKQQSLQWSRIAYEQQTDHCGDRTIIFFL